MTTLEPCAGGDTPPDVGCHSATSAALSADIDSLTALKYTIEAAPVRAMFDSVVALLTLVRVRFLALFPFHPPAHQCNN